ncbi:hypothetical protein ACLOJK_017413 [Asimina triloba]
MQLALEKLNKKWVSLDFEGGLIPVNVVRKVAGAADVVVHQQGRKPTKKGAESADYRQRLVMAQPLPKPELKRGGGEQTVKELQSRDCNLQMGKKANQEGVV